MRRPLRTPAAVLALTLAAGGWGGALAQSPPPAAAPPGAPAPAGTSVTVDQQGAQDLKAALAEGMRRWLAPQADGTVFTWQGDPVVAPAGDRYDVVLPALSTTDSDGARLDVGTVRLAVRPQGDGRYAFEATVPSSMTIVEKGAPAGSITIGRQKIAGVWIAPYDTVVALDAMVGDLAMVVPGDEGRLTVGSLSLMLDLQPDGPSTWSGPGAMAISELVFHENVEEDPILHLAGLTSEIQYSRFDLERANRLSRLSQALPTGSVPDAAEVIEAMRGLLDGATFRARITGLSVVDPEEGGTVSLEQFAVRGGVESLGGERATATLGFDARGLRVDPAVAPDAFMPERIDVQLAFANIPNEALWQAMAAAATEGDGGGGADAAMGRLVEALGRSGTELRLDKLVLDMPAVGGRSTGAARFAPDTAMGAVGELTVELRGLDAAVRDLQPKAGRRPDAETQETLGMLAMLQALGQQTKDEAGTDVRSYRIELTDTGAVLLNGADMNALMGGAPAAPPEPAPKVRRKE